MFIKYSTEEYLKNLVEKGEMYFNPAKRFRELEERQKLKGQGDRHDSGLHSRANAAILERPDGCFVAVRNLDNSIIMGPAQDTPVFCLKCADTEFITQEYYEEIKLQFPAYTHALIIDNERDFLENIRFSLRNRAFSHKVFYQNEYFVDFIDFMYSGCSDTRFYPIKKRGRHYYAHIRFEDTNGRIERDFFIDDSNYFRTMFRKDLFFQRQNEYRIVLPYERSKEGKIFQIQPFRARILSIDNLITENV